MVQTDAEDVLHFWLGPLDEDGFASDTFARRWWQKDPDFDREIRRRFHAVYESLRAEQPQPWSSTPRRLLATVIVLDQFPRNMFRGTYRMFESDVRALALARTGITRGDDRRLSGDLRSFLYMPLMHAECLDTQDECVRLFDVHSKEHPDSDRVRVNLRFAEAHREVIQRFGRFPHRNEILGRASTPEEVDYLAGGGHSF